MNGALSTTCVVAGGGPAGIVTGYLLARAGVDVIVLEKHADFLRDFRGDTIHPSTLELMGELGLLEEFLTLPHQKIRHVEGDLGDWHFRIADLTHLPTRCKFLVLMPQWDFLNFLSSKARELHTFHLMMGTEAAGLLRSGDRVTGVRTKTPVGARDIRAELVIAADGRHSRLRGEAQPPQKNLGAPMDVLWFKLSPGRDREHAVLGRIERGQALVMLDRGDYVQCALLIRKGTAEAVKSEGLAAFRKRIAALARRNAVDEIENLDEVKLLTVRVDRLRCWWQPGLLFIGDAAHAMSPAGGVGINLAIQDAVAAANILSVPLRAHGVTNADLKRVQSRRQFPTWATQSLQVLLQNKVIDPVLKGNVDLSPPLPLRLMQTWPFLQRLPARVIGLGFRPEHIGPKA